MADASPSTGRDADDMADGLPVKGGAIRIFGFALNTDVRQSPNRFGITFARYF